MIDNLSKSYIEKFLVRVEVLPEYQKRKAYSEVIRESQEALELFLKALLRIMGMTPTFSHDPGKELKNLKDNLPEPFQNLKDELIQWSRTLRRERELSYYGAADFIPTQEYSKEEAENTIEFLEKVAKAVKRYLALTKKDK